MIHKPIAGRNANTVTLVGYSKVSAMPEAIGRLSGMSGSNLTPPHSQDPNQRGTASPLPVIAGRGGTKRTPRHCPPPAPEVIVKGLLNSPEDSMPDPANANARIPRLRSLMMKRIAILLTLVVLCLGNSIYADEGMWLFNAFPKDKV